MRLEVAALALRCSRPARGVGARPPALAQRRSSSSRCSSTAPAPYAPNGMPLANGYVDYLKLVNARDGGINGVKITSEECETGYATDRGVECYERLKGKDRRRDAVQAAVDRHHLRADRQGAGDKIPLITAGYGRADSADGNVVRVELPAPRHLLGRRPTS